MLRKLLIVPFVLIGLGIAPALSQCQYGFANCWHCARNMCWSQAGQLSYYGTLDSWYCSLFMWYARGAGECNYHELTVHSYCDGVWFHRTGYVCCDIY